MTLFGVMQGADDGGRREFVNQKEEGFKGHQSHGDCRGCWQSINFQGCRAWPVDLGGYASCGRQSRISDGSVHSAQQFVCEFISNFTWLFSRRLM
mgnify:CR=1 FL=1